MDIATFFENEASQSTDLAAAINAYKKAAASSPDGYLNTLVFQHMRDGADDELVKRFFAKPFAEVRIWLPEMFGLHTARYPDHPYTYVVVDNLSDEYGKYFGHNEIEPSHAQLYSRVLDELGVKTVDGTMSTPAKKSSQSASGFYDWFKEVTMTEKPEYMLGHFLAYEITDVLDFPDYLTAAKRIWPDNQSVHEFFSQHAQSEHDAAFAKDLQPVFEQHQQTMVGAMSKLLARWTQFYQEAAGEIKE